MDKITLETEQEYNLVKSRGYEPLLTNRYFQLDIKLRKRIQSRLFGHAEQGRGNDVMAANERFFRWIWENKQKGHRHRCENCMKPLDHYSATFCSHILSRGAYPEMAIDPRNINILCFDCHNKWEHETTRKDMRIYESNKLIIETLKKEYICNESRQ